MLVSVYIRKEDEQRWKALQNKSEAIHKLLTNSNTNSVSDEVNVTNLKKDQELVRTTYPEIIKTPMDVSIAVAKLPKEEWSGPITKEDSARKKNERRS